MKELNTIQRLFTPIQPTLKNTEEGVSYREVFPDFRLNQHIYCYWQLKSTQSLTHPFQYSVVSDGCIDILWEVTQPSASFIAGFSNTYTEFPLSASFHYMGVRFLPTAFPVLFQVDASKLTNCFEELSQVVRSLYQKLRTCTENIFSLQEIKPKLDILFLSLLTHSTFRLDARLYTAIDLILNTRGTLSLEQEMDAGVSPRQLRRLFQFYIGDTPKTFCKVVRFQNILKAKPSRESLRKNKLFYDLGYYDQAHFIKEFKRMYGLSPTLAFK